MEKHNSRSSNTPNSQENELDSLIANTSEVDPSLAQELLAPHQANNSHHSNHSQPQQLPYSGVETRSGHSSPGAASASNEHPQNKTAKLESHSVIGQQQQMQNHHLQQQQQQRSVFIRMLCVAWVSKEGSKSLIVASVGNFKINQAFKQIILAWPF